jgi:hypothetical protein
MNKLLMFKKRFKSLKLIYLIMLKVRRSGLRPENLAMNGIRELKERKKERERDSHNNPVYV